MPTPHLTRHHAHPSHPSRLGIPGSPRDRGATLTLSSLIPARIPRSFASPDCSRCRSALSCPSTDSSARLMALGHHALRPQARPMVRPPICHASTPPAGPHGRLSHTSAGSLPTTLLSHLLHAPPGPDPAAVYAAGGMAGSILCLLFELRTLSASLCGPADGKGAVFSAEVRDAWVGPAVVRSSECVLGDGNVCIG